MNLFTNREILIMATVISVLLLIVIVLSISEILKRKKKLSDILPIIDTNLNDENLTEEKADNIQESIPSSVLTMEEENNKVEVNPVEISKKEKAEVEELIMEIEPVTAVKIENKDICTLDSKEKAQIELLKIEEELEREISLEDTITNLEAIEEENAIISYQELLSNTKELDIVTCDDGDEPITISEVFKMINNQDENINVEESLSKVSMEEAYHGDFVSTPYLSPISGLETENLTEIQLENTANLEKLDKEIRKTNEFLNILNELKKNLE